MRTRSIGSLRVSAVGLGAMGFSHGYGPGVGEDEAITLMRKAFDLGCTFFDTAEGYAAGANEQLVGRALAPIRDEVAIGTKFRARRSPTREQLGQQIRAHLEASLARLGTDHVELYYQHRVPDSIPVEDVAAVMGELIAEARSSAGGSRSPPRSRSARRTPSRR
jgi:aryl-alcohol dehydrogenase-like predicted oxidoreductase